MLHAVIVAGGIGSRLWPVSRKNSPKQLQPFDDGETMLQKTYQRLRKLLPAEQIWIETNALYKEEFFQQLPELKQERLIAEPIGRNTAAAVGLAAAILAKQDPEAVMINAWADHFIRDEDDYRAKLRLAERVVQEYPEYLVDIAVAPEYPATGYGYLEAGDILTKIGAMPIYKAARFVEKPDLATAEQYLAAGNYFWNTAIFVWKVKTLLELYRRHLPEMYTGLMKIQVAWGTPEQDQVLLSVFPHLEAVAIDYAIFEKAGSIAVLPASFGWRDVGSWQAVYDILTKVETDSTLVKKGKVRAIDTRDSLIFSENEGKLVAVVGMTDVVVVDTADALLVMRKSKDQDVRKIIEEMRARGEVEHL